MNACKPDSSDHNFNDFEKDNLSIKYAVFIEDRIFIYIPLNEKDTLKLFTDTGGGRLLYSDAVERLGIDSTAKKMDDDSIQTVSIDEILNQMNLPIVDKSLFLIPRNPLFGNEMDGMLGADWFAGHSWKFDYHEKKLYLLSNINWDTMDKKFTVELGFLKDSLNEQLTHFPRIPIIVGQDTIQMLFDTGATAFLDPQGKQILSKASNIGTSFIIASIFEKWEKNHPDWKVLKNIDRGADTDMIQVPEIIIANQKVGPVWFTKRDDKNFTEYMSQWMDEIVEGAIGGSTFQYFSNITIDYSAEKAFFNNN